jgi:hypothetical protein
LVDVKTAITSLKYIEPVEAYNKEIPNKETPDDNPAERMNLTPASLEIL